MNDWTPIIERAEAEVKDMGIKNFRIVKVRIQKFEEDFPTVWYRMASKGRPTWQKETQV